MLVVTVDIGLIGTKLSVLCYQSKLSIGLEEENL